MADRVITVTNPSVVTNDTLSGYNNYSDQDGLLNFMTPSEANTGKTVTLSDGVIHSVTSKPVGTANGEFTAVVSNAVSVDLTSSEIIMQDDFTGTTIDTGKWSETDPADGVTITQDDVLLFTVDRTSDVASTLTNNVESVGQIPTGSDFSVLQFDFSTNCVIGEHGVAVLALRANADTGHSIQIQKETGDVAGLKIYDNSSLVYDFDTVLSMDGRWKITYQHSNDNIKFYKWIGNAWAQQGATQTYDINQGGAQGLGAFFGQNSAGSITTGTFYAFLDNVYLSKEDYTGYVPGDQNVIIKDTFTKTILNEGHWTLTEGDGDGSITLNDNLILTNTAAVGGRTNYIDSIYEFPTGVSDYVAVQWTASGTSLTTGYSVKIWDGTQVEEIEVGAQTADRSAVRLLIRRNDVGVYDNDPSQSLNGTFKLVKNGNDQEFYRWNGSAWAQMGTTQTNSGFPATMTVSFQQSAVTGSGTVTISDVYVSTSPYTEATPS